MSSFMVNSFMKVLAWAWPSQDVLCADKKRSVFSYDASAILTGAPRNIFHNIVISFLDNLYHFHGLGVQVVLKNHLR
jgi:hypothetical protein